MTRVPILIDWNMGLLITGITLLLSLSGNNHTVLFSLTA
jgi:hypothetical protein